MRKVLGKSESAPEVKGKREEEDGAPLYIYR